MTRRIFQVGAPVLVLCASAVAQSSQIPGWVLGGTNGAAFRMTLDTTIRHGGSGSGSILCPEKRCVSFGTIVQSIRADDYLEGHVRLSAWIRGDKAGRASLWMRVDDMQSHRLAFDSKGDNGTFEWKKREIVFDVEPPAVLIHFGLILEGGGRAWIDDVKLESLNRKNRDTNRLSGPSEVFEGRSFEKTLYLRSPLRPVNLDFEQ
jgi:hypothetical protein